MIKRRLIVDDEINLSIPFEKFLTRRGFEVKRANNGMHALDKLRTMHVKIDLVITDLIMPLIDGYKLIETIQLEMQDISILVITGNAAVETFKDLIRKDMDAYYIKPIKPDELIEMIYEINTSRQRLFSNKYNMNNAENN